MSKLQDYLYVQKGLNNELQKNAKGKDILFLLFCVVFPFFTDNIFFNVIIFSVLGMAYVKFGIINLFSNNYIKEQKNADTESKVYDE